jgi:hypothetical protein
MARLSTENGRLREELARTKQEENINGLTIGEVKTLLRQKELIGFISVNRERLLAGILLNDKVAQLVALGLASKRPDSALYELTKRGQEIVNRVEFEMFNPNTTEH